MQGDSGSALVCKDENGIWTQVGIAKSFLVFDTNMICSNNLFVRVDHYSDMIYKGIKCYHLLLGLNNNLYINYNK